MKRKGRLSSFKRTKRRTRVSSCSRCWAEHIFSLWTPHENSKGGNKLKLLTAKSMERGHYEWMKDFIKFTPNNAGRNGDGCALKYTSFCLAEAPDWAPALAKGAGARHTWETMAVHSPTPRRRDSRNLSPLKKIFIYLYRNSVSSLRKTWTASIVTGTIEYSPSCPVFGILQNRDSSLLTPLE